MPHEDPAEGIDLSLDSYDFDLPPEQIAREPARPRDHARLLVVDRRAAGWTDSRFDALPSHLRKGDVLVLNNTRVIKARVHGTLDRTGRELELLFAVSIDPRNWLAMIRPGRRIRTGDRIHITGVPDCVLEVRGKDSDGLSTVTLLPGCHLGIEDVLEAVGHVPLPPYMERTDRPRDAEDYQTTYARHHGAIAAPTAGLHFSPETFAALAERGVQAVELTLHVGVGTFLPIRGNDASRHTIKPERFEMDAETAEALNRTRADGRRIVAVGTTTTRTLEYLMGVHGRFIAGSGETDLYLVPGHRFRAIDALVTNFHLPRSTLLLLVSAFAGRQTVLAAYRHAIESGYRFYSYGDATLFQ